MDSVLIAKHVLFGEPFYSFDKKMISSLALIQSASRIPVVESFTLSVNSLPDDVFVLERDRRYFIRRGLLKPATKKEFDDLQRYLYSKMHQ